MHVILVSFFENSEILQVRFWKSKGRRLANEILTKQLQNEGPDFREEFRKYTPALHNWYKYFYMFHCQKKRYQQHAMTSFLERACTEVTHHGRA
jgi:hypothetical protein